MENLIKELNEKAKDLNLDTLIETNSYIDYNFKGVWTIAYVERESSCFWGVISFLSRRSRVFIISPLPFSAMRS